MVCIRLHWENLESLGFIVGSLGRAMGVYAVNYMRSLRCIDEPPNKALQRTRIRRELLSLAIRPRR